MKCKPLFLGKQKIGDRFDDQAVFVFFGNRFFSESDFKRLFSNWSQASNRQVHGNIVRTADTTNPNDRPEGDALVSQEEDLALMVYSADCIPVLAHSPQTGAVGACHAGWRGVQNGIIPKFLQSLGPDPKTLRVWVGPHIRQGSFEVRTDVAGLLRTSPNADSRFFRAHESDSSKERVDLTALAAAQIAATGVLPDNCWIDSTDTFADEDYFSYRRQGPTGRLLSFIVKQSDLFKLR